MSLFSSEARPRPPGPSYKAQVLAYQLPGSRLREELESHGDMLHILLRYSQSLLTQMAQTAVCNRHHSLTQQFCRWLLLSLDRLPSNTLTVTQEMIANMLGVRREGVTAAAGQLQKLGVLKTRGAGLPCSTGRGSSGFPASVTRW